MDHATITIFNNKRGNRRRETIFEKILQIEKVKNTLNKEFMEFSKSYC